MQAAPSSPRLIETILRLADQKEQAGKLQMARKARFAAQSIADCFGPHCDIPLRDLDKTRLDAYLQYLRREGKTDNTISNYFRVLLSTIRAARKAGLDTPDPSLFKAYFTGRATSTRQILTPQALKTLLYTPLPEAIFSRTRDIFALCLLGGGLTPHSLNPLSPRLQATPEARQILSRYPDGDLLSFLGHNPEPTYLHNLSGLAHRLNLPLTLHLDSPAQAWAEIAKTLSIPHSLIAATIGRPIGNLNYPEAATPSSEADTPSTEASVVAPSSEASVVAPSTEAEIADALQRVAQSLDINIRHWYAIRCYDDTPASTAARIEALPGLTAPGPKHFYFPDSPSASSTGSKSSSGSGSKSTSSGSKQPSASGKSAASAADSRKTPARQNYMKSILFVNCPDADILKIRRTMAPAIYVFDYLCDNAKRPAPISDKEMKTFMYLSGLGADTLAYYFPEEIERLPIYRHYKEVTITTGPFAGVRARVYKKSKEKLNVLVRFERANICYTLDIPYSLLSPLTP